MKSFRNALASGQPQVGLMMHYPSPGVIERIGTDWDWFWIDGQHGQIAGYQEILAMVRACDAIQRPAIVRVPWNETGPIALALDMGAAGVIVPCVNTVEEAQRAVQAAKFPPLGNRSYGGRRAIDRLGRAYSDTANEDTLLIIQIESPAAVEIVDALAAVPGVDGLMLGPDDIMLRRGQTMAAPRLKDSVGADFEKVAAACRRHGKVGVMAGARDEAMVRLAVSLGIQMIVPGVDVLFLAEGSKRASTGAREWAAAARAGR